MGPFATFALVGALAILAIWFVKRLRDQQDAITQKRYHDRFVYLSSRFGPESAKAIMAARIWVGMSEEMLLESKGRPVDTDSKVLKTKSKQTWKYQQFGKNRYALRIFLEDGIVVGWDDKR